MNNIVSVITVFIVTFFAALGYLTIPAPERGVTDQDVETIDQVSGSQ